MTRFLERKLGKELPAKLRFASTILEEDAEKHLLLFYNSGCGRGGKLGKGLPAKLRFASAIQEEGAEKHLLLFL